MDLRLIGGERIIRGFLSAIGFGVASSGWNPWVRLYSGFVTVLQLAIILRTFRLIIEQLLYGLSDFYLSIFIYVDLLTQVFIFILSLGDLRLQRRITSLLEDARGIQAFASSVKITTLNRRQHLFAVGVVIVFVIVSILFAVFEHFSEKSQNSGWSAIYDAVLLMISMRFMVAPTLLLIFLLQFAAEKFTEINRGFQDSDTPDIVPLMKLHFKLAEFVDGLSEAFNVYLVVLTAFCFMFFTSNFLVVIFGGIIIALRACGFQTALALSLLYAVVSWGQSVSNRANMSTKLARRLEMDDLDGRSRKQLQLFLSSLACSPVKLSACDFFTIDKRMFLSVFAAVLAYIILFIQFVTPGNIS
ncbi:unnamed protein product [Darwinula stevensoni]|uniref:Gustatory receptor n=1 Tax=Darwinula stevensoni TaxID=69355 RepID=A0A7R9A349_9CRUS|nr:unnamed protein product [Darwinula stevensoni]CAG0891021.1 unnamed protein product [Darwinula stevensoni]